MLLTGTGKIRLLWSLFAVNCCIAGAHAQTVLHDSITVAIAPEYNRVTGFHRFLFGENYRPLWSVPVTLPVFHLAQEKGGLTIEQKGGGLQTQSLRLRDAAGREWVIRTIQKYPERGLPPDLRASIAKDILQDQVSAAHPFAALTVPPMADALGIPHSHPEIVYIPDDTALGQYRKDFANSVFLFEEREPVDAAGTDNTDKAQQKLRDDNDVRLDQPVILRARLLDMLIGDWDRHEDQWRWQKEKTKKGTAYTPVPRDRDQVYYNPNGVFPWLVSHGWLKAKFQGFQDHIRDINGFNFNARYFDRYFLNQLSESDWKQAIHDIQTKLTDSLIRQAVHLMPDTIFALSGEKIIRNLISRREKLAEEGMEYYRFLARQVDIPASDKTEQLNVVYGDDGAVDVRIDKISKSGKTAQVIYQRSFQPSQTQEIRLYGFDGNDVFHVTGEHASSITVRLIGGSGADTFDVSNRLPGKPVYIYDLSTEPNVLPAASKARLRLSRDSSVNAFDARSFQYDRLMPLISLNYNFDEGIMPRVGLIYVKHGFRREPYSMRQALIGNYSPARRSFNFTYTADFKKAIGNNDLGIDAFFKGPNGVTNFFGIGNEAVFVNKGDQRINYYRNRYDYLTAAVRLYHPLGNHFVLNGGIGGQYYTSKASRNTDHYLAAFNTEHPEEKVFTSKYFGTLVAGLTFDTRNDTTQPSSGWLWHTNIIGAQQLGSDRRTYGQITTTLSAYVKPFAHNPLVIANRLSLGTTAGEPYYFQQLAVGGQFSLRGFHSYRFVGKTAVYHNIELRERLFHFTSYLLPGSVGIVAFNDVGRVWNPGEHSGQWHDGFGGGLYIEPADLILLQAVVGHSREGTATYLQIGYRF